MIETQLQILCLFLPPVSWQFLQPFLHREFWVDFGICECSGSASKWALQKQVLAVSTSRAQRADFVYIFLPFINSGHKLKWSSDMKALLWSIQGAGPFLQSMPGSKESELLGSSQITLGWLAAVSWGIIRCFFRKAIKGTLSEFKNICKTFFCITKEVTLY